MDLDKGVEAYLKAKEEDVKPNNATFANLLSLSAGFGDQGRYTYQCTCIYMNLCIDSHKFI
jgi:CubicO group peptidase (beta-lactamase class C family)